MITGLTEIKPYVEKVFKKGTEEISVPQSCTKKMIHLIEFASQEPTDSTVELSTNRTAMKHVLNAC